MIDSSKQLSKIYPDFMTLYKAELKAQNERRKTLRHMEHNYNKLIEFLSEKHAHLYPDIALYGNYISIKFSANENDVMSTYSDFIESLSKHYQKEVPARGWTSWAKIFDWTLRLEDFQIGVSVQLPHDGIRDIRIISTIRQYSTTEYQPETLTPARPIDWYKDQANVEA